MKFARPIDCFSAIPTVECAQKISPIAIAAPAMIARKIMLTNGVCALCSIEFDTACAVSAGFNIFSS